MFSTHFQATIKKALFADVPVSQLDPVIANTFAVLFAQRLHEFALLRCVGATGAQVARSVRRHAGATRRRRHGR